MCHIREVYCLRDGLRLSGCTNACPGAPWRWAGGPKPVYLVICPGWTPRVRARATCCKTSSYLEVVKMRKQVAQPAGPAAPQSAASVEDGSFALFSLHPVKRPRRINAAAAVPSAPPAPPVSAPFVAPPYDADDDSPFKSLGLNDWLARAQPHCTFTPF